jgi:hypothetical protein
MAKEDGHKDIETVRHYVIRDEHVLAIEHLMLRAESLPNIDEKTLEAIDTLEDWVIDTLGRMVL